MADLEQDELWAENDKLYLPKDPQIEENGTFKIEIQGATVTFGAGAEVLGLKLFADHSTIQILGLPEESNEHCVLELLEQIGISETPESAKFSQILAVIKFGDPKTAALVVKKFEDTFGPARSGEISVREVVHSARFGRSVQTHDVVCSWQKLLKRAFLTYRDPAKLEAAKTRLINLAPASDVPLRVSTLNPLRKQPHIHSLEVQNLPMDADLNFFDILSPEEKPTKIKFMQPKHTLLDADILSTLHGLLSSIGPLREFRPALDGNGTRSFATATFFHPAKAALAIETLNNSQQNNDIPRLSLKRPVRIKIKIPGNLLEALRTDIDTFLAAIKDEGKIKGTLLLPSKIQKLYSVVFLYIASDEDSKYLASAKTKLDSILSGKIVMKGEAPLWSPFFDGTECFSTLRLVSRRNNLYVHRDRAKGVLFMFGGSAENQNEAQRELNLLTEQWELRRVTQSMKSQASPTAASETPGELDCVICYDLDKASKYVKPSCGHVCCADCLADINAKMERPQYPMTCPPEDCTIVYLLEELKSTLSRYDFWQLLNSSFKKYIKNKPAEFFYCPSADCESIFRTMAANSDESTPLVYCSNCYAWVCRECKVIDHAPLTCEEQKKKAEEEDFGAFKARNDIRDCPTCGTPIEKNEGCYHMECLACHAHICWHCMKVFRRGDDTYEHMISEHRHVGGMFLIDEALLEEDRQARRQIANEQIAAGP